MDRILACGAKGCRFESCRARQIMELNTSIEKIPRISIAYQKRLKRLNIETLEDMLFHFPYRYEDFSDITPINKAEVNKTICIQGVIKEIENIRTWHRKIFLTNAVVKDESGSIKVVWFNQPYLMRSLPVNTKLCLAGKVALKKDEAYLSNPIHEKIGSNDLVHTGRIIPIYSTTAGVSSRWIRYILRPLLTQFKDKIPEILSQETLAKQGLLPINRAIWQIHFPDSLSAMKSARKRFGFEQLFLIQSLVLRERIITKQKKAIFIPIQVKLLKDFTSSFQFQLTDSQRKTAWQILKDMEKDVPMLRLLQGDVGCGKTIVALMAGLNTIKAGYQTTFMAPTEILAKQHFQTAIDFLKNFKVNIGLLTGSSNQWFSEEWQEKIDISRKQILEKIENGEIDLLIGTHALVKTKLNFKNLALTILDEQHRFGVEQRDKLLRQEKIPHLLSMTATPIPRSLALSVYGNLDISVIDELPKGRKKIITRLVASEQKKDAYSFLKKEIKKGRQAFVICPRIEESSVNPESMWAKTKTVKQVFKELSEEIFPDLNLAILHGKIQSKQKSKIMRQFQEKEIDILVSTSVIEVGIDIPNASVIVIQGAERFGLAQLHQFRGRVGRAKYQSYCLLFIDEYVAEVKKRLKALIKYNDGLKLAEQDLKIRGAGDFIGKRQSGIPDIAMDSLKNIKLVKETKQAARTLLKKDPTLKKHLLLKEKLERFEKRIHLE